MLLSQTYRGIPNLGSIFFLSYNIFYWTSAKNEYEKVKIHSYKAQGLMRDLFNCFEYVCNSASPSFTTSNLLCMKNYFLRTTMLINKMWPGHHSCIVNCHGILTTFFFHYTQYRIILTHNSSYRSVFLKRKLLQK